MDQFFVGLDVAKDHLDIHVRPSGDTFVVPHDEAGLTHLVPAVVGGGLLALYALGTLLCDRSELRNILVRGALAVGVFEPFGARVADRHITPESSHPSILAMSKNLREAGMGFAQRIEAVPDASAGNACRSRCNPEPWHARRRESAA